MDDNGEDFGAFLVGLVFGGLVGAVAALLLAPQSGEETRELIREKSIEIRDQVATATDDALTKAEAALDDARERASALRDRGVAILDEQKSRLETAMSKDNEPPADAPA
jgi:gas vesicle protein